MNLLRRFAVLSRRKQLDADMHDEMRAHLDAQIERNLAAGMSEDDARAAAHRQFGGVAQIQERARDVWFVRWIDNLGRDLRFALRSLSKRPGFACVAIAMLALGIGLSTACFSVTNFLLLRSMPFPHGERLVRIYCATRGVPMAAHAPAEFADLKSRATSYASLSAFAFESANIAVPGDLPRAGWGLNVTPEFLDTLGLQPRLGRGFAPEHYAGDGKVVILPHHSWTTRHQADPEIVGGMLRVGTTDVTVIGILPPSFDDNLLWAGADFLKPATLASTDRRNKFVHVVARLKDGATLRQAEVELDAIAASFAIDHPAAWKEQRLWLTGLYASNLSESTRRSNLLITGLAILVLVIACANLVGLQLARAFARRHEQATRMALGASPRHLMMPAVAECLLLTAAGGAFGLLVASWLNSAISRSFSSPAFTARITLDGPVPVFVLVACLLTVFAFGVMPAWIDTRRGTSGVPSSASRTTTGRRQHRLKHAVVVSQFALAIILVSATTSLALAGKLALERDVGWHPGDLAMATVQLPYGRYADNDRKREFIHAAEQKLDGIPGVPQLALCSVLPLFNFAPMPIRAAGTPATEPERMAMLNTVGRGYFPTLGIRHLAGQDFPADVRPDGPPVVIVNESLARAFWPEQNAVGQRLHLANNPRELEVIGVVADVRMALNFDRQPTRFQFYRPIVQMPFHTMTIVFATPMPPATLDRFVRRAIADIDPDVVMQPTQRIVEHMAGILDDNDIVTLLLMTFAISGTSIAALGLYGVIAQVTVQRTREIGVRMALGATPWAVVRLILAQGASLVAIGLLFGLFGAIAVQRFYEATWPELDLPGVTLHASVFGALFVVALFACYLPARRAAKVDPVAALRAE